MLNALRGAPKMYLINQSHSLPHNTERSIFTLATHRLSKSHCSSALHIHHPSALHAAESTNSPVNPKKYLLNGEQFCKFEEN